MSLPFNLESVRRRPSMYLPTASFDVAAGYLMGIDVAQGGAFLDGFHPWLVAKIHRGNNLGWTELVLRVAFPDVESPRSCLAASTGERTAIESLFRCLEAFLAETKPDPVSATSDVGVA